MHKQKNQPCIISLTIFPNSKVFCLLFYKKVSYSERRAITGSFLAAIPEGIRPAIKVRATLMATSITPPSHGSTATPVMLAKCAIIGFTTATLRSIVTAMPSTPDNSPISTVSALNTREISRLLAPIERRTPISLVLSSTDIYVIISSILC